jgi:hypothetical protein
VDADRATPLEAFIYENEPALTEKAQDFVRKCIPNYSRRADEQFRGMLADLIAFVSNAPETTAEQCGYCGQTAAERTASGDCALKFSGPILCQQVEPAALPSQCPERWRAYQTSPAEADMVQCVLLEGHDCPHSALSALKTSPEGSL